MVAAPDFECFDGARFLESIDEQRRDRELSWSALGSSTGVNPSTIKRFATGEVIEADGVLALLRWLGRPLEDFSPANSHLNSGNAPAPARPGTMLRRDTARLYQALMNDVERNGVTLKQIAEATGTSVSQLKGFQKGGRTDIRTFLRVLNYLGADFHAFTRITDR